MTKEEVDALFDRLSEESTKPDGRLPPEFGRLAEAWAEALSDAHGGDVEADAEEIAAYVDGHLEGRVLALFEAKLAASLALRGEVEDLRADLAALASLDEAEAPRSVVGKATLAGLQASLEAGQPLTMEQQRALFTNPSLRADYNRLIRTTHLPVAPPQTVPVAFARARTAMPSRAAASSDQEIDERSFGGGTIRISSAGRPNQFLIRIRFDEEAAGFDLLELHGSDGVIAYLDLPPPYEGESEQVVDTSDPDLAEAVALLRDPRASGTFRLRDDFA